MTTLNKVLNVARSQIGYKESARNSNKYGEIYGMNNQPWCVIFLWWVFKESKASELFGSKTAACRFLYSNNKDKEVSRNDLKAGDIVFFDWSGKQTATEHVGIVESVNGSIITTIEGNTSSGNDGSQSNGDGVYRRSRKLSQISKAYRPKYINKSFNITLEQLEKGNEGEQVKSLQQLLIAKGFDCGKSGADGNFGEDTKSAVIYYQKAKKNGAADGIVGVKTWKSLLGI